MKKIILVLFLALLVGCEMNSNNTPTKKVEAFLGNYQSLSDDVQSKIVLEVEKMDNLTNEQKDKYVNLWKKHYQGLTYEVKNEIIKGDDASVIIQVEVTDYSKELSKINEYLLDNPDLFKDEAGNYSFIKYNDYRLETLNKVEDKVKHMIEFKLKKFDKKWFLEDLSDEDYLKLSGMYVY